MKHRFPFTLMAVAALSMGMRSAAADAESRKPANDDDLRYWLQNMVWHHRFNTDEIAAATGLDSDEIGAAVKKFGISEATRPQRPPGAPLLVLPYPGGRHPRIGFLDGAVNPQRETKVSVFPPWDDAGYVVGTFAAGFHFTKARTSRPSSVASSKRAGGRETTVARINP